MINFEPPFPPYVTPPAFPPAPQEAGGQGAGSQLFDSANEFYDWLMGTWLSSHAGQYSTYRCINQLLRIADCSRKQGQFLSPAEEERALENLKACRERLYNGEIRTQEIPSAVGEVVASLTHDNFKALLVSRLTEVEYRYSIYPSQEGPPDSDPELQLLFNKVVEEVTPRLLDIKARELARELASCLEYDKPLSELKTILQNWLGSNLY